ncbi:hypothetical protein CTR2_R43730 [Comamonas thiooxydans]|uniref:hypothetical protein n=1 Tax=Comamonas thiooxydans TaxID=363952 RepID=UPI000A2E2650|nr:hypothetical protein [Comamonas thiooxydans]BDR11035.1 hypothetical protein CTR2_R43730 [Comamonas thiooxydans]
MKNKLRSLAGIATVFVLTGFSAVNAQQNFKLTVVNSGEYLGYPNFCSDFYLKKTNDNWSVATDGNIKNSDYEYLKGCFVKSSSDNKALEFYIALNTRKGCDYRGNIPIQGAKNRTDDYYQCNSNFAKLNIFGGGFSNNEPINFDLLNKALENSEVAIIANDTYRKGMEKSIDSATATNGNIEYFFTKYAIYLNHEEQSEIAEKYLINNSRIQPIELVRKLVTPATLERVAENHKKTSYADYLREVEAVFVGNPTQLEIWKLKQRQPLATATHWAQVDFDNMVPKIDNHFQKIKNSQQKKAEDYLSSFRKSIKVGVDTHCGTVIEMRPPMIKLALNAPLAGYTSEPWIKVSEAFPPEYGCTNTNGRLSPRS